MIGTFRRHDPLTTWTAALVLTGLLGAFGPARAATPEERGYEIAALSDRSDRGFGDSVVELHMVLRNKTGRETERKLTLRTLEMPDESVGDKSLIVFESPADIDGTALLSHARILEPDDQWLYLPALKRVKRISSVNKSGPFVGSEFAFEDLTSLELEKYDYRWLGEEPCEGTTCDLVEGTPRYEHSGYTRLVVAVDREIHQVRRIDFFDRRNELLKTLTLEDYREYGEGWWRAHLLRMVNHKTGKSTDLRYSGYRFRVGLSEDDFVSSTLKRLR